MSFICSVVFCLVEGSPLPTQRILPYETIVNSMLSMWSTKRSSIPIQELIQIFSNIATYIHGNSASSLIHEEKMKEICVQSIKDLVTARGEPLYGFLHLTFQEYFTCLKLINIETTKRENENCDESNLQNKVQLVTQSVRYHTNDPRFQVPIALALSKINEYDSLLPLGAYMLINCGNDLVNYPSHDVLFNVLDRLIIAAGQHKWSIVCPFLLDQIIISLRKLRHDITSLWINKLLSQSYRYDIQTVSGLCHLIEGKPHEFENIKWLNQSSCSMLQSLLTLDNENNSFAIDRLLVKIAFFNHRLLPVNPSTFKGFLLDKEVELNSIPVILFPIIISLYGGLKRDGPDIVFDPFYIYRESTAVTPMLIHFLSKNNLSNQNENIIMIKQEFLKLLVTQIENQDESCETVDIYIAIICLYGIDYVQDNPKIISSSLLRMSMHRLKYISMILRQFYFAGDRNDTLDSKKVTKFISSMIEKFQYSKASKLQYLNLLNSLKTSMARLRFSTTSFLVKETSNSYERVILYLPNSLRSEYKLLNDILSTDIQFYFERKSCSLLDYFTKLFWTLESSEKFETQYRMITAMGTDSQHLLFRNDEDLLFSLTFIPAHLRNLYLRLLEKGFIKIDPEDFTTNEREHFFFGHVLLECLMLLSNISCKKLSLMSALITLLPMLRMHHLENFGSTLLWALAAKDSTYLNVFEATKKHPMNFKSGMYINKNENFVPEHHMLDEERRILIKKYIEEEQQRLQNALAESDGKSMKLYSACISLARTCRWTHDDNRLTLLEYNVQGALSIDNKLARLDALCVIGFYSHSDYDQIKTKKGTSLQKEIDFHLHEIYPDLSLLLHTAIFIRCLPLLEDQQTVKKCLQNLLNKFTNAEQQD
ncbi:unnamed protein product [Rotaria sp. Silwood2]|nr:unnamed protein product [Rotaria sp. Silwood2]